MIASLTAFLGIAFAMDVNQALATQGVKFKHPEKWTLTKSSGDKKVRTIVVESEGVSLEMTFMNLLPIKAAQEEAQLEYSSILSAYKVETTPYAGSVSKKLSCASQYSPKDFKSRMMGREVRTIAGFAGERKTFGACTEAEAALEFAFAATELPGDSLLKLTAFRKRDGRVKPEFWTKTLADLTWER